MSETVIIAPHCDDEIIGCFEVLNNEYNRPLIIYTETTTVERRLEAKKLAEVFSIGEQWFNPSIPTRYMKFENVFYFPGHDELHPAHRQQAAIGELMARRGYNVIFYSTNMNVPYIKEVKNPEAKKEALEIVYPGQSDLWKYEHKFFLFEAHCKWIF